MSLRRKRGIREPSSISTGSLSSVRLLISLGTFLRPDSLELKGFSPSLK